MSKPSILIVEDDPIVSNLIEIWLVKLGYTVAGKATTGEDAITVTREKRPDLVLMDIGLKGGIDGIDAANHLRKTFRVPFIYLTANAEGDVLERAKITEPAGFVMKPFTDRDLVAAIEMALYTHEKQTALTNRSGGQAASSSVLSQESRGPGAIRGAIWDTSASNSWASAAAFASWPVTSPRKHSAPPSRPNKTRAQSPLALSPLPRPIAIRES
jgi:CheY-like chemotaxis protein